MDKQGNMVDARRVQTCENIHRVKCLGREQSARPTDSVGRGLPPLFHYP